MIRPYQSVTQGSV